MALKLLSDDPVVLDASSDVFSAESTVDALWQLIQGTEATNSQKTSTRLIMLEGKWGEGKSSVMRSLHRRLESDQKSNLYPHLDVWRYPDHELSWLFPSILTRERWLRSAFGQLMLLVFSLFRRSKRLEWAAELFSGGLHTDSGAFVMRMAGLQPTETWVPHFLGRVIREILRFTGQVIRFWGLCIIGTGVWLACWNQWELPWTAFYMWASLAYILASTLAATYGLRQVFPPPPLIAGCFIDNLDRADVKQQAALLQALHANRDVLPPFVIVALDPNKLWASDTSAGAGRELVRKVFDVRLILHPKADEAMEQYCRNCWRALRESNEDHPGFLSSLDTDDAQVIITRSFRIVLGNNPRRFKHFLNNLLAHWWRDSDGKEGAIAVDLVELAVLLLISERWPELFDDLTRFPEYLVALKTNSAKPTHFCELLDDQLVDRDERDNIRRLLASAGDNKLNDISGRWITWFCPGMDKEVSETVANILTRGSDHATINEELFGKVKWEDYLLRLKRSELNVILREIGIFLFLHAIDRLDPEKTTPVDEEGALRALSSWFNALPGEALHVDVLLHITGENSERRDALGRLYRVVKIRDAIWKQLLSEIRERAFNPRLHREFCQVMAAMFRPNGPGDAAQARYQVEQHAQYATEAPTGGPNLEPTTQDGQQRGPSPLDELSDDDQTYLLTIFAHAFSQTTTIRGDTHQAVGLSREAAYLLGVDNAAFPDDPIPAVLWMTKELPIDTFLASKLETDTPDTTLTQLEWMWGLAHFGNRVIPLGQDQPINQPHYQYRLITVISRCYLDQQLPSTCNPRLLALLEKILTSLQDSPVYSLASFRLYQYILDRLRDDWSAYLFTVINTASPSQQDVSITRLLATPSPLQPNPLQQARLRLALVRLSHVLLASAPRRQDEALNLLHLLRTESNVTTHHVDITADGPSRASLQAFENLGAWLFEAPSCPLEAARSWLLAWDSFSSATQAGPHSALATGDAGAAAVLKRTLAIPVLLESTLSPAFCRTFWETYVRHAFAYPDSYPAYSRLFQLQDGSPQHWWTIGRIAACSGAREWPTVNDTMKAFHHRMLSGDHVYEFLSGFMEALMPEDLLSRLEHFDAIAPSHAWRRHLLKLIRTFPDVQSKQHFIDLGMAPGKKITGFRSSFFNALITHLINRLEPATAAELLQIVLKQQESVSVEGGDLALEPFIPSTVYRMRAVTLLLQKPVPP